MDTAIAGLKDEIVKMRAPQVSESLARQVAAATEQFRDLGLYKPPGVAETIDWANSLAALGQTELNDEAVRTTLGSVLKYREDQGRVGDLGVHDVVKAALARAENR